MGLQNQERWNMQSRARLVALGYSQVPGVDFTDNFAPVVKNVLLTFRIALTRMMMEELDCILMDVEAAFLYREIEEEIYMEVPVGMKEVFSDPHETDEENRCYQLLREHMVYTNQQDSYGKVCQ